ncbi:MAG: DinB family protein [Candidatus Heimdallarchaeota archaeon]|nr:DinB family protein [Candidatus Heimdallarchaeota archaeon]
MEADSQSNFSLQKSIEILQRTPRILSDILENLSETWVSVNEGDNTWNPFDIVGHFIHGDQTDWVTRAKVILSDQEDKKFDSFDRFAQFENSKNKKLSELLTEFTTIREQKIKELEGLHISESDLKSIGNHPELGSVNLQQLIATWVVHDMSHLAHILRIMANQYRNEVGPWIDYLRILK